MMGFWMGWEVIGEVVCTTEPWIWIAISESISLLLHSFLLQRWYCNLKQMRSFLSSVLTRWKPFTRYDSNFHRLSRGPNHNLRVITRVISCHESLAEIMRNPARCMEDFPATGVMILALHTNKIIPA